MFSLDVKKPLKTLKPIYIHTTQYVKHVVNSMGIHVTQFTHVLLCLKVVAFITTWIRIGRIVKELFSVIFNSKGGELENLEDTLTNSTNPINEITLTLVTLTWVISRKSIVFFEKRNQQV